MHQMRLIGLLLGPSVLSSSLAGLLAFAILTAINWLYITPENPLYSYLFGPYGITTVFQNSSNALTAINGAFSSPQAYNIAVLVFALFVGLVVYVFLQGIDAVADHAKVEINEVAYVSDQTIKKSMRKEAQLRLGLRLATLTVWIVYMVFWVRVIVPYGILLGRLNTANPWTISNIWRGLAAFGVLIVSFHILVVLARLFVLRPRLLGRTIVWGNDGGH